jgi:hypothetical protein
MERHQYSNTETYHLWRAWEEVSGKPIAKIMSSWTEQMGFPLLTIDARTENADHSVTLSLSQKWFLADGSEPDDRLWTIPVSFQAEGQEATSPVLMSERTMSLTVPATDGRAPAWIKLNAGQHVNMRVAYDDISGLIQAVASKALGPEDRAGLLLDAFALTKANHPSMTSAKLIELTSAYRNETHATVWESIDKVLVSIDKVLLASGAENAALRAAYVKWASDIVHPAASLIGWEDKPTDGHLDRLMRSTLMSLQSRFCLDYPDVVARAHELWNLFFELPEGHPDYQIPADYKVPIFKIVLATTEGSKAFDTLMTYMGTLTVNAEKKQVYAAIGCARDLRLKRKVLEWAISGAIKLQVILFPFFEPFSCDGGRGTRTLTTAATGLLLPDRVCEPVLSRGSGPRLVVLPGKFRTHQVAARQGVAFPDGGCHRLLCLRCARSLPAAIFSPHVAAHRTRRRILHHSKGRRARGLFPGPPASPVDSPHLPDAREHPHERGFPGRDPPERLDSCAHPWECMSVAHVSATALLPREARVHHAAAT